MPETEAPGSKRSLTRFAGDSIRHCVCCEPSPAVPAIIAPAPDDFLRRHEVSPAVNRAANEGPELIVPATQDSVAHEVSPAAAKPKARRSKPADHTQASLF